MRPTHKGPVLVDRASILDQERTRFSVELHPFNVYDVWRPERQAHHPPPRGLRQANGLMLVDHRVHVTALAAPRFARNMGRKRARHAIRDSDHLTAFGFHTRVLADDPGG